MKYHIAAGVLIAFGIAIVVNTTPEISTNSLYVLGIFGGGLFIGLGLLPFPMIDKKKGNG